MVLQGKFSDTAGRKKVLVFSLLGTAMGYFTIGLADSLLLLALARIPVGKLSFFLPLTLRKQNRPHWARCFPISDCVNLLKIRFFV